MKVVILAGGAGTRISEESVVRPKPMVEIGHRPILWHIMKGYSKHGLNDFVICCGYKGHIIKEYFANYFLNRADVTFDLQNHKMEVHAAKAEPWKVTLVDTGDDSMTGGRLKRVKDYLDDETFCMTYGDGVSNVDITESIRFHREHGRLATLTAVQPPGRFGGFILREGDPAISSFSEKPSGDGGWINAGFFVLEPEVIDQIVDDSSIWEREPLQNLAKSDQLSAFVHEGFWHPMDTLRDKLYLEDLYESGNPPWRVW